MTTPIKKLLTGLAMGGLLCSAAVATSVREYQGMTKNQKSTFLVKETDDLLAKVKDFDPTLEQTTRAYMFDETNSYGYAKGLAAIVGTIDFAEINRPETLDKIQVETITKVVMQAYWKKNGMSVPSAVFGAAPSPPASTSAGH